MKGQRFVIEGRDGSVLHEGIAPTRRKFLAGLFAAKASFKGADLRGWSLNNHVMDGLDFRGADLDGADLSGTSACGGDFGGALLRGVKADGFRALNARFAKADLSPSPTGSEGEAPVGSRFRGADFSGADMSMCVLDSADLSGATCRATRFLKAHAKQTKFAGCNLSNAQFALSTFVACDFAGADMTSATGAPVASLPDRTAGATVCDNVYGNARLDEGAPAFGRDRRAGKLMRAASWGVSALAIAGLAGLLPEEAGTEMLKHAVGHVQIPGGGFFSTLVGNGLVIVAAVKLASFVREAVEHATREHLGKGVMTALRAVKAYASEARERGLQVGTLCVAAVRGPGHGSVRKALSATSDESSFLKELVTGDARLILCDRGHLARALVHLHVERTRDVHLDRDLVILRHRDEPAEGAGPAPTAFRLGADGGASAAWRRGSRFVRASWDAKGEILSSYGFHGETPSMESAKAAFELALWDDHGLRRPYLTKSHQVAAGRDGSIQVIQERTGLLNNPWGAAFIGRDGRERHYRKGVEVESMEIRAESEPAPAAFAGP